MLSTKKFCIGPVTGPRTVVLALGHKSVPGPVRNLLIIDTFCN